MEVHHHPHVEKKSFKEYLLEGLMIFLAVSMGFIAEQIREHFVEKKHETEYMESLVRDLKLDTAYLNRSISIKEQRKKAADSVLQYFHLNPQTTTVPASLIPVMRTAYLELVFMHHSGTIDQLKNSGGFRLLREVKLVDSIESYYQQIKRLDYVQGIYANIQRENIDLLQKLLDGSDIASDYSFYLSGLTPADIKRKINIYPEWKSEYINKLLYQHTSAEFSIRMNEDLKTKATALMKQISKKYKSESD
jgi:hypothetical protein